MGACTPEFMVDTLCCWEREFRQRELQLGWFVGAKLSCLLWQSVGKAHNQRSLGVVKIQHPRQQAQILFRNVAQP